MKIRNFILVIVLLFASNLSFSQDCPRYKENREKIEAEKVAFITDKLDLTVKEAQDFWPIYNEYQKKREEVFIEKRKLHKNLTKNLETLSDKEIIEALNKKQIFPRRYFYPSLDSLPYVTDQFCDVSRDIASRILCLPLYYKIENSVIEKICNVINEK